MRRPTRAFAIVLACASCTVRVGEDAAHRPNRDADCKPSSVQTGELAPRYTVQVENGTARATAELDSTAFSDNYELNGCEALLFNGNAMSRTNAALIVFDQSYVATLPALTEGLYRFELRRSAGESVVSEIPAVTIALSEPRPNAILRPQERVRIAWSPAIGDEDVSVVMTVLGGRATGGQIAATAKRREGGVVLDAFDWPVLEGEAIALRIGALVSVKKRLDRPFAGGEVRAEARASVEVTLTGP